jgi:hypothetical protein
LTSVVNSILKFMINRTTSICEVNVKTLLRHTLKNKYFWHFCWLPNLYTFSLYENASFIIVSAETEYISTRSWYIINFPNMCSNIPASLAYGVYISQLIRYARTSSNYSDFLKRHLHLRNTTQVIRHRVKILFSVISSLKTLEHQKWKSSKKKGFFSECFEILSAAYPWREEDPFHFWQFSFYHMSIYTFKIKFYNVLNEETSYYTTACIKVIVVKFNFKCINWHMIKWKLSKMKGILLSSRVSCW